MEFRTTQREFQILIISCKIIKEVFYIRKDLFYMNDNRSKNQPRYGIFIRTDRKRRARDALRRADETKRSRAKWETA